MAIIGIDLGTTNSLVSVWEDDGVKLIPNSFGENLTPSVVSVDINGSYYVGKIARERLITQPEVTFKEFKRDMGTNEKYKAYNNSYTPEDLSSFILKQLKADAEQYLKEEVTEAIISVPAYFNDKQRAATRNAGVIAGLKVERLINEPSAAALAYRNNTDEEHQIFIVFDFGGGTLDVSLVDAFDNIIEIQAVAGDNRLGGKDFNEIIAKDFCNKNNLKWDKLSLKMQAVLYRECENIKIQLTSNNEVKSTIRINNKGYEYDLSNQELINISVDLFRRMTVPLQRVMNDSGITLNDLSKVILVGGSSKMPVVRHYIASMFDRNVDESINPDEIVGMGAGVTAGIKERKAAIKDVILSDICPFTLGIDVIGGRMSPIINKNQILPCSRVRRYVTTQENQREFVINAYQGESMTASVNLLLDTFTLKLPPMPKSEAYADVRFSYDINGLFDIDIISPFIKNNIHKSLVNKHSGLSEEELAKRCAELEKMKIHPRDMQENKYILEAAGRLYEECNIEQQAVISEATLIFNEVLETQDLKKIRPAYVKFTVKLGLIEQTLFHFSDFDSSFWNTVSDKIEDPNDSEE